MSTTPASPAEPAPTDATGAQEQPQSGPSSPGPAPARRGRLHGFRAFRWPGFRIYFMGMLFRGLSMCCLLYTSDAADELT